MDCLTAYPFPENVRELENEIERAMVMAKDGKFIEIHNLSEKTCLGSTKKQLGLSLQGSLKETVETLEKSVLSQTLEKHGSNKTRVAKELGLSRYGLIKKMQRYNL